MMSITSFFNNPSGWGIGLAVLFGIVWLVALKPLKLNRLSPWLVMLAGAVLFAPSIAWIQAPLQTQVGNLLISRLGLLTYQDEIIFTAIPVVLLSGLVQEGAKLLPVVIYWFTNRRILDPKLALTVGAMAGAGFGIVEGQWVLNSIFASGWHFSLFQTYGFLGIAGFYERFFTIAFHTASAALVAWGLAKGYGWQFYLLASFLHFLTNYTTVFYQKGLISIVQIEIIIGVFASVLFAVVAWLRYRPEKPVRISAN